MPHLDLSGALYGEWLALAAWLSLELGLNLGEALDAAYTLLPALMDFAAEYDRDVAAMKEAAA